MSKKNLCKKVMGICLVAMMAVGSIGRYAEAANGFDWFDEAYGGCDAYKNNGTAYTVVRTGKFKYGTVTATYWCGQENNPKFTQGNGAGGVHGASVSIYYNGDTSDITYAEIRASHGMTDIATDQVYSVPTDDDWQS